MSYYLPMLYILYGLFLPNIIPNLDKTDYTYLLSVTSSTENEQYFSISVENLTASPIEKNTFKKILTPFKMELDSGEYIIIVSSLDDNEIVSSHVQGYFKSEKKGSASAFFEKAKFHIGPQGRYNVSKLD